ncbi:MAG: radical SAM protein [Candidatus Sumerlaeia bacterium]|nr:radical SAM protein [Candidatus Sumerlaeia bacterium]
MNTTPASPLRYVIYFVTSRCNSRCQTCFYWKEMDGAGPDLSLQEVEAVAAKIGPLETLLLSGGEPTLRNDLPEVVAAFFLSNRLRNVGLPTNGLLPERARLFTRRILELCPGMALDVNVSLDGVGAKHDAIRGVPGAFEKACETVRMVAELRQQCDRLRVNVSTVVFDANWRHLPELLDYVREHLDVNGHYVELLRGAPRDSRLALPPYRALRRINRLVLRNHLLYHGDAEKRRWPHETPYLRELHRWQERVLRGGRWPASCPAGREVAVIESDGRVRACELRGVVGDLRQSAYDLHAVLQSPEAAAERQTIVGTRCSCTHCVFLYEAFAVHGIPNERRRRWLERWLRLRGRLYRIFR